MTNPHREVYANANFCCPACGVGIALLVRASKVVTAAMMRAEIEALLPRLPDGGEKARKVLDEWAGDSFDRLSRLLFKVELEVNKADEAKAAAEPVIDPETRDRVEGKAPPYPPNERDPWGLNGPAEEAAKGEPLKLENPRAEPQHRTMPADALPRLPPKQEPPPGAGDAWEPPDETPPPARREGPGEDEVAFRSPEERRWGEHFKRWAAILLPEGEPVRVEAPPAMKPPPGQKAKPVVVEKTRDQYVAMWLARPDLLGEACKDLWARVARGEFLGRLGETYGGAPGWERLYDVAVASLKKGQISRADAILAAEQTAAMHAHKMTLADAPNGIELAKAIKATKDDPRLTEWARGEVLRSTATTEKGEAP